MSQNLLGAVSHYLAAAAVAGGALGVRAVFGPQWGGHAPLLAAAWGSAAAGRLALGWRRCANGGRRLVRATAPL